MESGEPRIQILAALEWAEGNRTRAARKLGISRATMYRRLREFGIPTKGHGSDKNRRGPESPS